MKVNQIARPTALGAALFKAAAQVPPEKRLCTIASNIVWRGETTDAGVIREPSIRLPKREFASIEPAAHDDGSDKHAAMQKEGA